MVTFEFDPDKWEPLAKLIAKLVTDDLRGKQPLPDAKLAIPEKQAAKLLSLNPWQLAHERKAGKIDHVRTVGKRILYTGEQIKEYLRLQTERGN